MPGSRLGNLGTADRVVMPVWMEESSTGLRAVHQSNRVRSATRNGVFYATMQPNSGPTQRLVHTENTHPPPVTAHGPMVDPDGTVNNANTGTSVAAHSTANPTNNIIIDTTNAPTDTSTTTVHGKKRRRKQNNTAQNSRKHHRRMTGFTATQDDTPGADPDPDKGHSVGN